MKLGFLSEDIIQKKHLADLAEVGDFEAEYIEIDVEEGEENEPVSGFRAYGTWKRYEGEDVISTPSIITVLEIENAPTYQEVLEGGISPGQLFQLGWEDWTIEEA